MPAVTVPRASGGGGGSRACIGPCLQDSGACPMAGRRALWSSCARSKKFSMQTPLQSLYDKSMTSVFLMVLDALVGRGAFAFLSENT